jgi:hypothetical protein
MLVMVIKGLGKVFELNISGVWFTPTMVSTALIFISSTNQEYQRLVPYKL